jgi:hypothetical protein
MKTDSEIGAVLILIFCGFLMGMLAGFVWGGCVGMKDIKANAVKRGHAVWVVDAEGSTSFQWKEISK